MATVVDNTSIASAQERAASILYGNEKPIAPVTDEYQPTATAMIAEYSVPVKEQRPAKPKLSSYYHVTTPRHEPQSTEFRSYQPMPEPISTAEPQVIHPFVEAESIPVEVAPVAVTKQQVKSEIDIELEEDTQYVVRFKTPTIIAAAALATIFLLMAILFIVNIVSLSSTAATVGKLLQEEQTLNQELDQALQGNEIAKNEVLTNINLGDYQDLPMQPIDPATVDNYQPASPSSSSNGGFFDWVCQSLSGLFG